MRARPKSPESLNKGLLRLARSIQNKYGIMYKELPGRMSPLGRKKLIIGISKLFVEDRKMRGIMLNTLLDSTKRGEKLARYALQQADFNREKAFLLLDSIEKKIELVMYSNSHTFNPSLVLEIARKKGMKGKIATSYLNEIEHVVSNEFSAIIMRILLAKTTLEKEYRKAIAQRKSNREKKGQKPSQ